MSVRTKLAIGFGVLALTVGGLQALEPKSSQQVEEERRQQLVEQAADAEERANEQRRRDGEDAAESDRLDKLRPGEHRPPEPEIPRIRIRTFP